MTTPCRPLLDRRADHYAALVRGGELRLVDAAARLAVDSGGLYTPLTALDVLDWLTREETPR